MNELTDLINEYLRKIKNIDSQIKELKQKKNSSKIRDEINFLHIKKLTLADVVNDLVELDMK